MKPETLKKVLILISRADHTELDAIVNTFNRRREQLRQIDAQVTQSQLKVGAQIRTRAIKPKYMNGLRGKITELNVRGKYTRVALDWIPAQGSRRFGQNILLLPTQMEVISNAEEANQ